MSFAERVRQSRASVLFFSLFAAALLLAAVSMSFGFAYEEGLRQQIARSNETRARIVDLFSLAAETEANERGYLLTRDQLDLRSYDAAKKKIDAEEAWIKQAIDGDAHLNRRFSDVASAIDKMLENLSSDLAGDAHALPRASPANIDIDRDAAQLEAVQNAVTAMAAQEDSRLASRRAQSGRYRLQRNILMLSGIVVIGVVMGFVLWRDDKRRSEQVLLLRRYEGVAARQAAIFGSAMDAIITLNPSGSIETINAAGLRLFGYEEAELIRRDISVLIDIAPDARGSFIARLSTPGDLDRGYLRELNAKPKTGGLIPVDVALSAMSLPEGVYVVAVVRDISERRVIESLKDNFIATVSHELRTPLTSIAGSLGLLKGGAGGKLPKRAERLVEIAQANSARLVRLINDILDMEKIRSGATVFHRKPLQIKELAQTACESMSGLAFEREVDLGVDDIDPALWMLGDHDRMMQVLGNLLSNAIKVSPKSGCVRIAAVARGAQVRISISDQGPGVPPAFREKIFTPFAQADQTDGRDVGGTGLGLSIAREVVERHDGVLNFASVVGAGAVFFLDVPLIDAAVEGFPAEASTPPRKFLICEDDELIAEVLHDQLESFGCDSDIVSTANEARHALHTGGYAGMLLDIRLPDSNGVTLMQALRAAPNTAGLPIIAMSGSAEHKEQAEELGLVAWLEKPIRLFKLEEAVNAALATPEGVKPLILHVDDDRDLAEIVRARLGGLGEIVSVPSLAAARAALAERIPNLVILDLGLPDGRGETLLSDLRRLRNGGPAVILYTAQDLSDPVAPPIEAILVKSRSDLSQLSRIARKLIETGGP